jgi:hypothetical protein
MLNNYPIHAFDHIEISQQPVGQDASFLQGITYRGIKGAYPIAGNPKLRAYDCDCVLGMRLQEKEVEGLPDYPIKHYYPEEEGVFVDFVKNLMGTLLYGSEEGQIRSVSDEERSVAFYATIDANLKASYPSLFKEVKGLPSDATEFSIGVEDFSTPAINRKRGRKGMAKVKSDLQVASGELMKKFLDK